MVNKIITGFIERTRIFAKDDKGIGVVELILILVDIFTYIIKRGREMIMIPLLLKRLFLSTISSGFLYMIHLFGIFVFKITKY